MTQATSTVRDLECQIRNIINKPRIQHSLLQDRRDWMQLCASLDVLGDTQLAIDTYSTTEATEEAGAAYLLVFGFYQACFLQQDATTHMAKVLQTALPANAGAQAVRERRNDIVGHPTERGRDSNRTSFAISRATLSRWSFDVITFCPVKRESAIQNVNVRQHFQMRQTGIENRLRAIVQQLQQRIREHATEKLADIFPASWEYHCGKIFEGTQSHSDMAVAKANLNLICDYIEKLKVALTQRGEFAGNDLVCDLFTRLANPIERLIGFFSNNSPLNSDDAYALAFFFRALIQELMETAHNLDISYEELSKSA